MPIKVMLVDDAIVVRRILRDALTKDPDIEVVGVAPNGRRAMEDIGSLAPDVVVLDVEMPEMDGIETLAAIKRQYGHVKVIMFSTLTGHGAQATVDALMLGAEDYVTKPANVGSVGAAIERINDDLVPKIKALGGGSAASTSPVVAAGSFASSRVRPLSRPEAVVVAVSTGGPNALGEFLPALPADLSVPVLIVQHIPATFSAALAERLNKLSALAIDECKPGTILRPGQVWIAAGDKHMTVQRQGNECVLASNQDPPENSCRPAADVLFRSAALAYGAKTLGVVLTGMGYDGLKGSQVIVDAGGTVLAQDEASSVVWGMPGAVAEAGLARSVLPLGEMAGAVAQAVGRSAVSPSAVGVIATPPNVQRLRSN